MDSVQLRKAREAVVRHQVLAAREDPVEFCRFIGRQEGDRPIRMGPVHTLWHRILDKHDRVVLFAPVGHGKQIPITTPIATPTGWRAIGDLVPGDLVLGRDGLPTRVSWVSEYKVPHTAYELTFKDGATIQACADHEWAAWTIHDRDANKPTRTATTQEIVDTFESRDGRKRWSIPVSAPAQYPEQNLPIHPYTLGAWLGDGSSACGALSFNIQDREIVDRAAELGGYGLGKLGASPDGPGRHQTLLGLRTDLREAGLLKNKHIPAEYLIASESQRRELLAGLMDTDGHVSPQCNRLEFTTTSKPLADGALELARSLGYLVTRIEGRATLYGKDCGPKWRVGWTAWDPVFRLKRKADAHAAGWAERKGRLRSSSRKPRGRTIVSWKRVENPGLMCCIGVEAEHHTYVATRDYIVTHNSNQITRWRLLYEMMKNPDIRIGVVSVAKSGVPAKFLASMRADIEENKRLRLVAPHLRRATTGVQKWSGSGLTIQRTSNDPNPTVSIFGLYGKILGRRLDLIILDDVCNMENTITQHSRDKMWDWISGEVLSRMPANGGRVWAVGHVWDEDDVLARMSRLEGYHSRKFSAFLPDPEDPDNEIPLIPEVCTIETLRRKEAELGPLMSKLMLRNELPDKGSGRIRQEWFAGCLQRGQGLTMLRNWNPAQAPAYTGVDVATGRNRDRSCAITAVVHPDGSRQIIDIRSGDWDGPEILKQLKDITRRYGANIAVEGNGAQKYLQDFAANLSCMTISDHHTGMNKHHANFGIEGLGTEVYNGKWILPSTMDGRPGKTEDEELQASVARSYELHQGELAQAIKELCAYTPDPAVHTGDRAMAWWILREAIRKSPAGQGYSGMAELNDAHYYDFDSLVR